MFDCQRPTHSHPSLFAGHGVQHLPVEAVGGGGGGTRFAQPDGDDGDAAVLQRVGRVVGGLLGVARGDVRRPIRQHCEGAAPRETNIVELANPN